jgi:hypothetical protein
MSHRFSQSVVRVFFLVIGAWAAAATPVLAQASCYPDDPCQTWSVVGTGGIADESAAGLLSYSDTGSISFKSSASGTAQVRYPILPVGIVARAQTSNFCLGFQFRDTGAGSRVVVALKSVNHWNGVVTTHRILDSDQMTQTGSAYETSVDCNLKNPDGSGMTQLDMLNRAWYVDVQLSKTTSTGNPGLKTLFLTTTSLNP